MRTESINRTFTADFGYIGTDILSGEEFRRGNENLIAKVELPEITTGTEKQIKYANSIRYDRLRDMAVLVEKLGLEKMMEKVNVKSAQEVFDIMLNNNPKYMWIIRETSAKVIIDNHR